MTDISALDQLGQLRDEIDRIDGDMHELLIARGEIIDRLIAVKARQGGGSAFRPGREAEMMRVIAARHRGRLPLDTVESIWRVIISTFTYIQAPYAVHAEGAAADPAMRDSARFHFGFTVPLRVHEGPRETILAVAASLRADGGGDLGMIRVHDEQVFSRWWRALEDETAPKIIARLPFVERPDHPAGLPVFVISNPLAEAAARDVAIFSAQFSDDAPADEVFRAVGCAVLARDGEAVLASAPGDWSVAQFAASFAPAPVEAHWLGSHARRFILA